MADSEEIIFYYILPASNATTARYFCYQCNLEVQPSVNSLVGYIITSDKDFYVLLTTCDRSRTAAAERVSYEHAHDDVILSLMYNNC